MSLFAVSQENFSDQIALNDLQNQRTWQALQQRCVGLAAVMQQHYISTETPHLALLMENRLEYIEIILAAILAGVWVTPVNCHLKQKEIEHIISDSGAKYLITDNPEYKNTELLCEVVLLEELEKQLALQVLEQSVPNLQQRPGGTMMYTSGTTGLPKGVKRSPAASIQAFIDQSRAFGTQVGFDGGGTHLITGPLYHAAPMLLAVYDLLNGAPLIIMPKWDETLFIDCVNQYRVAHSHLVPTMFERLLKLPQHEKQKLKTEYFRMVHHGAAPVAQQTKQKMIEWWGPVLVEYWGATEGGITTLCNSEQWLAHTGTVGKPLPQFEVFAVDDQNNPLPQGEVGVLFARHLQKPQVFEYHNDPLKTQEAHPEPHTFTLGDMGYIDEEGYVYLTDRKQDMIISGGVNIYPVEIEQCLAQHSDIDDIAVVGLPDQEWGEKVVAVIQLSGTSDSKQAKQIEESLQAFARQNLAGYKCPRQYHFVSALPRNPAGKLMKRLLIEELVN